MSDERREHLLEVAKALQECQKTVESHGLSDVGLAIDTAIVALQKHVEFNHAPDDELLKFFGLDDLKQAETWWQDGKPEA
jgi:hypothetical protein